MLQLLTMYIPQFYSSRAGGDAAGLSIDGFHLKRTMFCWNIHFGALELLDVHWLQIHVPKHLNYRLMLSVPYLNFGRCCPLTAVVCTCNAVLTLSPHVLMSTLPWMVPAPLICPPRDLSSISWPWNTANNKKTKSEERQCESFLQMEEHGDLSRVYTPQTTLRWDWIANFHL